MTLAVAVAALYAAGTVYVSCTGATSMEAPMAGTERAGYCSAVNGSSPWVGFVLVPAIAMASGGWLLRSRRWLPYVLAGLIIAAVITNTVVVSNMTAYIPGP